MSSTGVLTTMSVETFVKVAASLPANVSVLLRAKHGVGKSQLVRQLKDIISERTGIKFKAVIDRRLSQLSEGDVIGLPSTDGNVTRFNPPDWYMQACLEPCILFLDEQNRATPEVMQASFQIVLDRELNGWKLHPDTRVYSAINTGAQYTVNDMDPALLDRFWVIDLLPTTKDWLKWATERKPALNDTVIDFIRGNDKWLHEPKNVEPGTKHPSPRSWERLNDSLEHAKIIDEPENPLFWSMCVGFVGTECANAFFSFAKSVDGRFTGEDILNRYKNVKKKIAKLGHEKMNVAIDKLVEFVNAECESLSKKQKENLKAFMEDLDGERRVLLWTRLTAQGVKKLKIARDVHDACMPLVLDVFGVPPGAKGVGVTPNIPNVNEKKGDA